jgi:LmbE family N-acetylglucosaminyl deacetylase
VPALKTNPVFLYSPDSFQKPNPFQPDIIVAIDDVLEQKLDALGKMESQFYEGSVGGSADLIPADPVKQQQRRQQIRSAFAARNQGIAQRFRTLLVEWYGKERAEKVKHAEAFEVCEYGRRPSKTELGRLFPFFTERPH